jgi:hypothetical protein
MPGRPPVPRQVKLLKGTFRPDRVRGRQPQPDVGCVRPRWLTPAARVEWNRIAPRLIEARIVTTIDADSLGIYCSLLAEFRTRLAKGDVPSVRLSAEIRAWAARFGITPSDRERITVTPAPVPSKLEKFLSRRPDVPPPAPAEEEDDADADA